MVKHRKSFHSFLFISLFLHGIGLFFFAHLLHRGMETSDPMKTQGVVHVLLFDPEEISVPGDPPSGSSAPLDQKRMKGDRMPAGLKKETKKQNVFEPLENEAEGFFVKKSFPEDAISEPLVQKVIETHPAIPIETSNRMLSSKPPSHVHPTEGVSGRGIGAESEKSRDWMNDALMNYKEQIGRRIRASKRYPPLARDKNLEGRVILDFTIGAGGHIEGIEISDSSREKILDREAVDTIRRASPLPPIPEVLGLSTVKVRIPLNFDLDATPHLPSPHPGGRD